MSEQFNIEVDIMNNGGYLRDLEKVITTIFDRLPIEKQPQVIVNIGSGNEALVEKVYKIISHKTLRGKYLEQYPLKVLASDHLNKTFENLSFEIESEFHLVEKEGSISAYDMSLSKKILFLEDCHGEQNQTPNDLTAFYQNIASLTNEELFITTAANMGFFSEHTPEYYSIENIGIKISNLEKRDYIIRPINVKDLKSLYELETLCWPKQLRTPQKRIRERLQRYTQGQFVLEKDGQVLGVIYSQRIASTDDLEKCNMDNVYKLHDKSGTIIQLIAVNIHPQSQNFNYGNQLLEFMLQRASLIPTITKIVAVTLCKNFNINDNISFQQYIKLQGKEQDPILAFHYNHGATIVKELSNYRVRDIKNQGYGVLIEYNDLPNRRSRYDQVNFIEKQCKIVDCSDKLHIDQFIENTILFLLNSDIKQVDKDRPLMEMGLNSVDLLAFQGQIEEKFQLVLKPGFFFEHSTSRKIVEYLAKCILIHPETNEKSISNEGEIGTQLFTDEENIKSIADSDIAVIGISCKLPGNIDSLDKLWQMLISEKCAIDAYPKDRGSWPNGINMPGIDRGGFVNDADKFDASFFRMLPSEAQTTDPQQRMLLELAWSCLEDANILPKDLKETNVGVFVGASNSDYSRLIQDAKLDVEAHYAVGNSLAVLANRISYYFDFTGPSLLIDTACSSSLVALHTAIQSLHSGESGIALVGGINLICHPDLSIAYYKAGMLSPDAQCKVFDASANGYVRSEGGVVLLLKPLRKAIEDRNQIHAIIKGSSINHGGLAAGLTVPNPQKQSELLLSAWKNAGIINRNISYIEAHGTGTSLGDPIEFQGIQAAYLQLNPSERNNNCSIGSIKSNLGHLESASGITGLLKVILSLKNQTLPATINHLTLNPKIHLADSPFQIQNKSQAWDAIHPYLAGVSSFGSGGANAHVVVQEYITEDRKAEIDDKYLFVLSAHNRENLLQYAIKVNDYLKENLEDENFSDAIYSWQLGRTAMRHRLAMTVKDKSELCDKLEAWIEEKNSSNTWVNEINLPKKQLENLSIEKMFLEKDLDQLGELWTSGIDFDWNILYIGVKYEKNKPRFVSLPTYPFKKERFWVDSVKSNTECQEKSDVNTLLAVPKWQRKELTLLDGHQSFKYSKQYILLCNIPQIEIGQIEAS
ncbi:MAG: GNAT family N-acetyltransferase, partial [Bacteroidales bacterium]|nr:GNAT family N-acetyltransferase [Bacteroidales bacterium]